MTLALLRSANGVPRSEARSHVGLKRRLNEDRVLERPELGFWAVADGMGGHARGDVAAQRLIDALAQVEHGHSGFARVADVAAAAERVNAELFAEAAGGMGATLVALILHEGHCACLWAGDSRAYLLRAGELVSMTRDHSHVQDLVDAGALSESARRRHPEAHLITRAVGAHPLLELERRFAEVTPGDVFLLCSDGLTACLEPSEAAALIDSTDLGRSADALITAALEKGAPDNVSLVLLQIAPG